MGWKGAVMKISVTRTENSPILRSPAGIIVSLPAGADLLREELERREGQVSSIENRHRPRHQ